MALAVFSNQLFGLLIGQVPDTLTALEMELDPEALVLGIDEAESVTAEAMHVAVGAGIAAITHQEADLMQRRPNQRR
jgi:hypothetical protein